MPFLSRTFGHMYTCPSLHRLGLQSTVHSSVTGSAPTSHPPRPALCALLLRFSRLTFSRHAVPHCRYSRCSLTPRHPAVNARAFHPFPFPLRADIADFRFLTCFAEPPQPLPSLCHRSPFCGHLFLGHLPLDPGILPFPVGL